MEASCWVARKIFLSLAKASSRARTLDSRPTTNGVIMYGKMTTSRMGIIGSFLLSNFSLGFDKLWSPVKLRVPHPEAAVGATLGWVNQLAAFSIIASETFL